MKRQALIALIGLWALAAPASAQDVTNPTPPNSVNGAYNSSAPTCTDGHGCWIQTDINGNLKTVNSGTPSGTQDINIKQVQGAVPSATNPIWVAPATANVPWAVSLPTTPTIAAGNGMVPSTSSESGAATTTASSTAAESNRVLKSSAGNLYDLTITIGATSGYVMLFDATALPSNGAVTPVWCYPVTSNGTNGGTSATWPAPKRFGTGITAGFSTTGCFTLTASATANFFGDYK